MVARNERQTTVKFVAPLQSTTTKDLDEDLRNTIVSQKRTMNTPEMVTMSTAGILLIFGVLLILSLDDGTITVGSSAESTQFLSIETLEVASTNIVEAAIPMSVSDVVAIAFGEAIAGIVGAAASFLVSLSLKWNRKMKSSQKLSEAVADGDFLLTQAAALPLLEVVGFSPLIATLSSIGLAMVPFSLIKLDARRQDDKIERQKILLEKLKEEEKRRKRNFLNSFPFGFQPPSTLELSEQNSLNKSANNPPTMWKSDVATVEPDFVETFSDITKWLQYSILTKEFSGVLSDVVPVIPSFPGVDSALFGSVATVSSQLYSDVLYGFFGFGNESKRDTVRNRSFEDWSNLYLYRAFYAATLFGVFGFVQAPVRYVVNAFLSGGVDACYGSTEFNACIETYLSANSPGATPEAQLRSLIAAAYSTIYNYGLSEVYPFSSLIETLMI